jgi:hypothetical protein
MEKSPMSNQKFEGVIDDICGLNWGNLVENDFISVATAPNWNGSLLQAFKHFLSEHIRFDSDPEQGHGALCRHLTPDDRILPLWAEFKHMLIEAIPSLLHFHRVPTHDNVSDKYTFERTV